IDVKEMNLETGIVFLLRRAGLSVSDAPMADATGVHYQLAKALIQELGGLPLALDQAGAYIEETGCDLDGYLTLYRQQRQTLLNRRGGQTAAHPEPVATTWSLAFSQVEQLHSFAADLLCICAFF